MSEIELPPLTQQPIIGIDGTPDKDYPLRILRAYRENCNVRWNASTDKGSDTNPVYELMNEHQQRRAKLLDQAIAILEDHEEPDDAT